MSVRRITAAAAFLGVGLAAQASAAGTPVKVTATKPAATPVAAQPAAPPAADAVPSGPVGKVEIKETVFDAGSIDRGTDVSHSFSIKNVGPGDLTVDAKPG